MANINETISEVEKLNPELARQLKKYVKDHSYGLVFEHNLPEAVRLYTKIPTAGDTVNILPARGEKEKEGNSVPWVVKYIDGSDAMIEHEGVTKTVSTGDIVTLVSYRDVIYPGLKEIDRIERGDPEDPYHMVINSENYHALEALAYCYSGKVDCIYIDPPYNTGAKDWKYNNDYVDSNDQYRHSKWLAFMERRLKLAKQLLNPKESMLIVTIDEKEYLRLGLLLEQTFPGASIQMITDVINAKGVARQNQFSRVDEYIFFVLFGEARVALTRDNMLDYEIQTKYQRNVNGSIPWPRMLRRGSNSLRAHSEGCFYPIFVDEKKGKIDSVGYPPGKGVSRNSVKVPDGCVAVWPMHKGDVEGVWQLSRDTFLAALKNGTAKLGRKNKLGQWSINYLNQGLLREIETGSVSVVGRDDQGAVMVKRKDDKQISAKSVWNRSEHEASQFGSVLLQEIVGKRFSFPKSLYAERDTIRFAVKDKPDALIVDFFAGSGTTLHAVNLLNAADGGHRRCICVTNNEVSADEAKKFTAAGLRQGDPAWEAHGIAHYVTWPRTKCSIEGVDVNGNPLKGNYLGSDMPMADGFKANAIFCELTYESAWPIRLDRAFDAIAPILWMQAGCRGSIIRRIGKSYLMTNYLRCAS